MIQLDPTGAFTSRKLALGLYSNHPTGDGFHGVVSKDISRASHMGKPDKTFFLGSQFF